MINVTAAAAQHLTWERLQRGLDASAGVRFLPMAFGVGMTFLPGPKRGDKIETNRSIRFFIAPDVAARLDGSTLDVADRDGNLNLVLRPPNTRAF